MDRPGSHMQQDGENNGENNAAEVALDSAAAPKISVSQREVTPVAGSGARARARAPPIIPNPLYPHPVSEDGAIVFNYPDEVEAMDCAAGCSSDFPRPQRNETTSRAVNDTANVQNPLNNILGIDIFRIRSRSEVLRDSIPNDRAWPPEFSVPLRQVLRGPTSTPRLSRSTIRRENFFGRPCAREALLALNRAARRSMPYGYHQADQGIVRRKHMGRSQRRIKRMFAAIRKIFFDEPSSCKPSRLRCVLPSPRSPSWPLHAWERRQSAPTIDTGNLLGNNTRTNQRNMFEPLYIETNFEKVQPETNGDSPWKIEIPIFSNNGVEITVKIDRSENNLSDNPYEGLLMVPLNEGQINDVANRMREIRLASERDQANQNPVGGPSTRRNNEWEAGPSRDENGSNEASPEELEREEEEMINAINDFQISDESEEENNNERE